ncbi:mitochondrial import receptor subunit TOM20 homolog [Chrysoperla carnea]|uniref:mitochondrial import receptor subunit TOM20 homolog n=1 Tax=Chrysoperla carnea TaxID=189513 RepID=UPI001D07FE13|nr:mitochondrial import receptor subunit TOM20 homolog [Chrysoperla carnea]
MVPEISKTAIGIAAGVCGTIFLGYCIYFDKQRRSQPDFKKKLHEKRKAQKESNSTHAAKPTEGMPDLKDDEAVRRYFLQEVQLGEEMLATGELEQGVEHLANAVAACGVPHQLLQVFQSTLPPQVFHMLLTRMSDLGSQTRAGASNTGLIVDDVE